MKTADFLAELGLSEKNVTIHTQPAYALAQIIRFENKYNLNTATFLNSINEGLYPDLVTKKDLSSWMESIDDFRSYEGDNKNLNSQVDIDFLGVTKTKKLPDDYSGNFFTFPITFFTCKPYSG